MADFGIAASGGGKPYQIEGSWATNYAGTSYYSLGALTTSDRDVWTVSFWFKRCSNLGALQYIFSAATSASIFEGIGINASGRLVMYYYNSTQQYLRQSEELIKDTTNWHHVVVAKDSGAGDTHRAWLDGVEITDWQTNDPPTAGQDGVIGHSYPMYWGVRGSYTSERFDGSLAECIFIDGTAYDASDFGEFHPTAPDVWRPIDPSGLDFSNAQSHWLKFTDDTTTTTMGYDSSGNDNHFTPNGTIGTYDSTIDSPTNCFHKFTANNGAWDGIFEGSRVTLTDYGSTGHGYNSYLYATTGWPIYEGKWYVEFKPTNNSGTFKGILGVCLANNTDYSVLYEGSGSITIDGVYDSTQVTYVSTDILGIALDADSGTVAFYKNGTLVVAGKAMNVSAEDSPYVFVVGDTSATNDVYWGINSGDNPTFGGTETAQGNTDENGHGDFYYAPPAGYLAYCQKNMPQDLTVTNPKKYFDVVTYTGNAATRTISTENKVDLVVIKNRSQPDEWKVVDSTRGATKELSWDSTNNESTDANGVTAFGTTSGFDLGTGAAGYNDNGENFVAYCWTKSATAGFDIVSYTGTGSNTTVAHNLGVAPSFMMVKKLATGAGADGWYVEMETHLVTATTLVKLDTNIASTVSSTAWNDTPPTASVFSLGTGTGQNDSGVDYIAYLWAKTPGLFNIESYYARQYATDDATQIHSGIKPRMSITKRTNAIGEWVLVDSDRDTTNDHTSYVHPDLTNTEGSGYYEISYYPSGAKQRNPDNQTNAAGSYYISAVWGLYNGNLFNNGDFS